jgi:diaminopimelate epimerase
LAAIRSATELEPVDGVMIGLNDREAPFDVLIMNTDGSLAERSGNGLTIFARALADLGRVAKSARFCVRVHHARPGPNLLASWIALREPDEALIELGAPSFGPAAVGAADGAAAEREDGGWCIHALKTLDARWERSVLVRLGNPHCVTFLSSADALPDRETIEQRRTEFARIAFEQSAIGNAPFQHGINLQWATLTGAATVEARIFERGEGWTQSSGSSASAVAAAAFHLERTSAGAIEVRMPGGRATVFLEAGPHRSLQDVRYAGRASKIREWPGERLGSPATERG